MPAIPCHNCGRQLAVTAEELATGIFLECARCNTRVFVQRTSAPWVPKASAITEPAAEDDAGDVETDRPLWPSTRAPATKPFLIALGAMLGLVLCLLAVFVAVQLGTGKSKAATRTYPDNAPKAEFSSTATVFALLYGCGCLGLFVVVFGTIATSVVLLRHARGLGTGGGVISQYRSYGTDWRSLRGPDFEHFLSQVFEALGYHVRLTKGSGDQGADLVVTGKGKKIAVQAKGYANSVGNHAVMEVVAGMGFYQCDACVVITNSSFTVHARRLAAANGCRLIDGTSIPDLIEGRIY